MACRHCIHHNRKPAFTASHVPCQTLPQTRPLIVALDAAYAADLLALSQQQVMQYPAQRRGPRVMLQHEVPVCRADITKASYGEATLHKQLDDDVDFHVLNGQQRLISVTILLSVLRHLACKRCAGSQLLYKINKSVVKSDLFTFTESEGMKDVTRIQVRNLQSNFFAMYISPAIDNLSSFWNEEGTLLLGLAGADTVKRRFMQVADALKQVCGTAFCTHCECMHLWSI